jgi:hypothetical protein
MCAGGGMQGAQGQLTSSKGPERMGNSPQGFLTKFHLTKFHFAQHENRENGENLKEKYKI